MTTKTTITNSRNEPFASLNGPCASVAEDTVATEGVEPVVADLAKAGISFKLLPDDRAKLITDARQQSLNAHPFAPLIEGCRVPQPIPSEQTPGHSYITYSAPGAPEEPSRLLTSAVAFFQNLGHRISHGSIGKIFSSIGKMFSRLGDLLSRLEDKDTVELRKIHPLLGSGLGLRMTDADLPGHRPETSDEQMSA